MVSFDTIDHGKLREILDQRVRDGVLRRTIDKWLKAGVFEDGEIHRPEAGSPQGGVVSPVLANVYVHEVLDTWFEWAVRPRLRGRAFLVRYADDFVIVFSHEEDARRVLEVLPKRFGRYGLTIHPEKTRLVRFRRPQLHSPGRGRDSEGESPGTFDLLGFTHYWGRTRRGSWVVKRRTASKRFTRAVKAIWAWCRANRHAPIREQHALLRAKVRGHYQYYGIRGNSSSLSRFNWHVERAWRYWLGRRSQRAYVSWDRFLAILARYPLPPPRVNARGVT